MTHEDDRASLIAENAHLREQIAELAAQNAALATQVQELQARLAKDSHNSGKPPVVFSFLISSDSPQRAPRALIAEIGYAITPCDSGQDSGEVRRGEGKRDAARGRVRRKLTAWRAPACPAGQETNGGALVARLPGQPPVARIGAPPGAGLLLQPVHDRRECAWLLEQAFDGDPLERLSALPDADLVRLRVDLEHDGVPGQRLRHVLGRV